MEAPQRPAFEQSTRVRYSGNDDEDEDEMDVFEAEDFGQPCKLSTESFQRVQHFLKERLKLCQDSSRPCRGIPSLSAMNAFLQLYFEHFAPQLPFIHAPTLEPENMTELLVISIATIGCHYSRSRRRHLYRCIFMQILGDWIKHQVSMALRLMVSSLTLKSDSAQSHQQQLGASSMCFTLPNVYDVWRPYERGP